MLKTIMLGYDKQIGSHWFKILGETYFGNQSLMSKKLMPKIRAFNVELCNS